MYNALIYALFVSIIFMTTTVKFFTECFGAQEVDIFFYELYI